MGMRAQRAPTQDRHDEMAVVWSSPEVAIVCPLSSDGQPTPELALLTVEDLRVPEGRAPALLQRVAPGVHFELLVALLQAVDAALGRAGAVYRESLREGVQDWHAKSAVAVHLYSRILKALEGFALVPECRGTLLRDGVLRRMVEGVALCVEPQVHVGLRTLELCSALIHADRRGPTKALASAAEKCDRSVQSWTDSSADPTTAFWQLQCCTDLPEGLLGSIGVQDGDDAGKKEDGRGPQADVRWGIGSDRWAGSFSSNDSSILVEGSDQSEPKSEEERNGADAEGDNQQVDDVEQGNTEEKGAEEEIEENEKKDEGDEDEGNKDGENGQRQELQEGEEAEGEPEQKEEEEQEEKGDEEAPETDAIPQETGKPEAIMEAAVRKDAVPSDMPAFAADVYHKRVTVHVVPTRLAQGSPAELLRTAHAIDTILCARRARSLLLTYCRAGVMAGEAAMLGSVAAVVQVFGRLLHDGGEQGQAALDGLAKYLRLYSPKKPDAEWLGVAKQLLRGRLPLVIADVDAEGDAPQNWQFRMPWATAYSVVLLHAPESISAAGTAQLQVAVKPAPNKAPAFFSTATTLHGKTVHIRCSTGIHLQIGPASTKVVSSTPPSTPTPMVITNHAASATNSSASPAPRASAPSAAATLLVVSADVPRLYDTCVQLGITILRHLRKGAQQMLSDMVPLLVLALCRNTGTTRLMALHLLRDLIDGPVPPEGLGFLAKLAGEVQALYTAELGWGSHSPFLRQAARFAASLQQAQARWTASGCAFQATEFTAEDCGLDVTAELAQVESHFNVCVCPISYLPPPSPPPPSQDHSHSLSDGPASECAVHAQPK